MKQNKIKCKVVVVSCLLLSGAVFADETEKQKSSSVELGALYVSKDSFKFGEYTGLEEKGTHAIANVDINRRAPHDAETARYWNLYGWNFGLTSREAYAEYGNQGKYKLWAGYDQLPQFYTESAKTVFSGAGTTNLTLPSNWFPAQTTEGLTKLSSSIQDLKVSRERRKQSLGFSKHLSPGWEWDAEYHRETQEGNKITGASMGWNGGNARTVLIPEPIDYVTNQFTTRVRYATSRTQMQGSYMLSFFDNKNTSLTWTNPYAQVATVTATQNAWASSALYANGGKGRIGLPPDNRFHRLMLTIGHNLSNKTRFSGNLSWGRMAQNQAFLPYTVNSGLTSMSLPRGSLNGRIDNTLLTLKVTSRPFSRFHWMAQYRFDDRKNRTPRNQYVYVGGDSQIQPTTLNTDKARTNLPFSFTQNQFKAEGGYNLPANLQLRGTYVFDNFARTFSPVKRTRENTFKLELKRNPVGIFGGGIYAATAKRNGTAYQGDATYLASYSQSYIDAQLANERFSDNPQLRIFSMANRLRKQLGFWASCMPRDTLSLQLNTSLKNDDYTRSVLGLKKSDGYQATLEAAYTPTERISSHAFYTHEFLRSNLNGRAFGNNGRLPSPAGGLNKAAQSQDVGRNWFQRERDRINTLGAGVEFTALKDKYDFGMEYLYSLFRGKSVVTVASGIDPAATYFPLYTTRLHSLEVYGKYKITTEIKAKISYLHERFASRDWAKDGVRFNTLSGGILSGETTARYAVNVFGLSLGYDF